MNLFAGEKISIVSAKPQTTRNKIRSILTGDGFQIIFIDTPGIHKPQSKLGAYMVKSAENAMNEVDCILYLVEPGKVTEADRIIISRLNGMNTGNIHAKSIHTPVYLAVNKIDTVDKTKVLGIIEDYHRLFDFKEIFPISAKNAENTDELLSSIKRILPEGPQYFPQGDITDQPEKRIVSELIREKALFYLRDEIPHGVAVDIERMKKREAQEMVDIDATVYCEKDSHKGIIIGKNGGMLKKIGAAARQDIERLLGSPVYLQLWLKVKKDWRDNDLYLRSFGYNIKDV